MIFKRVKKIFSSIKKPSRKTFWKIGLFLVFAGMVMNINISTVVVNDDFGGVQFTSGNLFTVANAGTDSAWYSGFTNWLFSTEGLEPWSEKYLGISSPQKMAENMFLTGAAWLLYFISDFIHILVLFAAKLFDASIDPKFFDLLLKNNEGVYIAWAMVRDFLNLFFMLALLFSAFATIFQVEKYHLKKIIILLVVMALLVNFSYPITLFVIDFSNSAMYFLVNLIPHSASATATSQSALVANLTNMGLMLKEGLEPKEYIVPELSSIIFQFIIFVTLFAFAINLLIRLLAFVILLIFSPAGFALSFFPSTSKIADSWWDNLIKYAVMGPTMIFFLLIANLIFNISSAHAPSTSSDSVGFIGSSLLFTVPIVFLWMGMIASNKFGGTASSTAMGIAKNTGNWVKNKGGRMAYRGVDTASGHRISGGIGAIKRGWDRMDENYKSKSSARSAKYAERIGVTGAEEQNMVNQANEYKKKGLTENALKSMASNGDASAAYLLAENKKMDEPTYAKFIEKIKNEKVKNSINGKVKQSRIDLVAIQKANDKNEIDKVITSKGWSPTSSVDIDKAKNYIIEKEIGGLDAEKYAQQDWKKVAEHVKALNTSGKITESLALEGAVTDAFTGMTNNAKNEVQKRLIGQKAAELRTNFGIKFV